MKRWPLHKAYFWETAPFFRLLLPFAAGIICYDRGWLSSSDISAALLTILIALTAYASFFFIPKLKGANPIFSFSLLYITLFFSGLYLSALSDIRNDPRWFGNNIHSESLARITEAPSEKEHSWKVPVSILTTMRNGKPSPASGNAFVYLYKDNAPILLHKGDTVWLPANWQPIKNAGNPFEFDYATYCRRNNLSYQQSSSAYAVRLYATADPDKAPLLERSHDWCMEQLGKYITDPKTRGLIQAMLLGDEVNLDEDLRQSYSETGIIHIIAISGGNVAIFFIVISALLWWLRDRKHLWVKYAIALPLVWFYVMMAGAQPSAIRAAIMFSLLAFGIMLQKNNNSLNQLFATAFLLLCAQPMWLFSAGFQLSFVAVLSLILFYKPVYNWVAPANKISRALWSTIAASISAEVLVAPLVIYYFHTFPLLFIVSNVLAYLFMSLALVLGIAIIALSFVPAVAKAIGIATVYIVTVFDKIVTALQGCNPVSFHFLTLSGAELVITYFIITGIVLFLLKKQKRSLLLGLSAACLLLVFFCHDQWTRLHQQHFVVYNTGKANHIEIISGTNYSVLYADTANTKKTDYAVKPAHTYWQAWNKATGSQNEIFSINGKTILLLNEDINTTGTFPVDYLVVNYTGDPAPDRLQRIFTPSCIIIGNNYSRRQQADWAEIAATNHIPIHIIAEQGAFIR